MQAEHRKKSRILIFVVLYNAKHHILSVLQDIPEECLYSDRYHILCIDDASKDNSAEIAAKWADKNRVSNITVLCNPENLGYGGNQKLGYRFAIDHGFDYVILLHGDGQHFPELVPNAVKLLEKDDLDLILGTRMHSLRSAFSGGMPVYKILGNLFLTLYQNKLLKTRISEFHSGFRGFSTRFLKTVPFEINTNDFHFDTEIILQALEVKSRVGEFPIPTRYGDEICHVNSVKYGLNVIKSTFLYKLHKIGIHCSLKYMNITNRRYNDKTAIDYSSHKVALQKIKSGGYKSILDLGCGDGSVGNCCRSMGIHVTGLDIEKPPPQTVDKFIQCDLNMGFPSLNIDDYECILALDVIEHLDMPEFLLMDIRNLGGSDPSGKKKPTIIISTPNIAFISVRISLLFGRYNYGNRGILDITHKRLFTRKTLVNMLKDCGYKVKQVVAVGVPFNAVLPNLFGTMLQFGCTILAKMFPTVFAFQYLVVCEPSSGVEALLKQAKICYRKNELRKDNSLVQKAADAGVTRSFNLDLPPQTFSGSRSDRAILRD